MNNTLSKAVQDTTEGLLADGLALLTVDMQASGGMPVAMIRFSTGLATEPRALERRGLGLATQLVVPPGTWAAVRLPGGERQLYEPGSYWIWSKPGAVLVQWVDARRQQVPVGPIEGWSADKWRVRLWLIADVEVADPVRIADHREPLNTLVAAVRASALRYIEQHSHAALTGCGDGGSIDAPAHAILERLRADEALQGLHVVKVRVVERQGDERQIEAATAATVAAAQIDEELRVAAARNRARLHELEAQSTIAEREHILRMAAAAATARERLLAQQSEVQQAALAARLDIVLAQIRAQTAEIAHEEQVWQAEQQRFQAEWEQAQQRLMDRHQTDQQLRLMDGQAGVLRGEAEVALAAEDRRHAHERALADVQQRIHEQRALQAQAMADRRAQHEAALLELHLRHEQLVAEQMQRLEHWRAEQVQLGVQQQRQHDRQMAVIAGTAQVAAAAAQLPGHYAPEAERHEIADEGLRALQALAE